MIGESSRLRVAWEALLALLIVLSCLIIPFRLVFHRTLAGPGSALVYLIDLFFFMDMSLNFFTSYRDRGEEVRDARGTAAHYLKTWFPLDLAANVPLDALFLSSSVVLFQGLPLPLVLRLPRLLRIVRLHRILSRWEMYYRINPGYFRIVKFVATAGLLIHWIACAWLLPSLSGGHSDGGWVTAAGVVGSEPFSRYVLSLYWTVTTMTTVGYGDITPTGTGEYLFATAVMLLGASMYAYVIGNVVSLLGALDSAKQRHWGRIDAVTHFLRRRKAAPEIVARVRNYYEYMWGRHAGVRNERLIQDLPEPLQLEILSHIAGPLLEKVPLFTSCSPFLRRVLVMSLKQRTYGPGDIIAREGDAGEDICFISRGDAVITSGDEDRERGTLGEGDYFGHLSLMLGERRTASVTAKSYCETFHLEGADYHRIKSEYPEFREVLKKVSAEKSGILAEHVLEGIVL